MKLSRRHFVSVSGGFLALPSFSKIPWKSEEAVPVPVKMERLTLDLGHRGTRGGPITQGANGKLFWITTEPEAPYLAKAMWPISRIAMRSSVDGGKTWDPPQILQQGTKDYSLLSHIVFATSGQTLLHIFVRYSGYDYKEGSPENSLSEVFYQRSLDQGATWTEPMKMPTGERYQGDILSMEQTRDGRLIYPFCFLTDVQSQFAVSVMYSDDDGVTWTRSNSVLTTSGGGFESGASEPTVVELKNGRLWMLIRAQTGFLWESFSDDKGKTWSEATESNLPSSNAPANLLRLKNGDIAICWNPHNFSNYARQSIVMALTTDGKNITGLREFDFTDFTDPEISIPPHVTYPFMTESSEGYILVSYNKGTWPRHNRPTLARISRNWIVEKRHVINFEDGRTGWHTIDPGPLHDHAIEKYVQSNDQLCLDINQHPSYNKPTGIVRNFPLVKVGEITIICQVPKPEAYIRLGNSLLSPRRTNDGVLRIRLMNGQAFLAAGIEERVQNDRKTTKYSYISHEVKDEKSYPIDYDETTVLRIRIAYNSDSRNAIISINEGPGVELNTANILGLSYLCLSTHNGGVFRLYSIHTQSV